MFFTIGFYIALTIFGAGVLFKISSWLRHDPGGARRGDAFSRRLKSAAAGAVSIVFSAKLTVLIRVFVCDVVLQVRIFREDFLRWLMHMLIFAGFLMLLLMHAFEQQITASIFSDYASTINPFLFLRNLFGAMVLAGLGIAVYRRFVLKAPRRNTNAMDTFAIVILAVVMVSGLILEAVKITSYSEYQNMVEDFSSTDDETELKALESVWVQRFSLVSPRVAGPFDEAVIAAGLEIHQDSCVDCHSSPRWAFGGYLTAKILSPAALALDRAGLPTILWYVHFLACFVGLAYLPFSKLFHVISTPLSILSNAVMDRDGSDPLNIATRQALELDACTHCGACSRVCSVAVSFETLSNANILPSEKLVSLKAMAGKDHPDDRKLTRIQEGLFLCTNCHRCTTVCPSGINLQDLWFDAREALLKNGHPEPLVLSVLSYTRGLKQDRISREQFQNPVALARAAVFDESRCLGSHDVIDDASVNKGFKNRLSASLTGATSHFCFSCTTCTSTCPVVRNFENPPAALGLLPHQIIRAANFGLGDQIFRSEMLWSCLGCYACQDSCPQGVRITDVFYELKNLAVRHGKEKAAIA